IRSPPPASQTGRGPADAGPRRLLRPGAGPAGGRSRRGALTRLAGLDRDPARLRLGRLRQADPEEPVPEARLHLLEVVRGGNGDLPEEGAPAAVPLSLLLPVLAPDREGVLGAIHVDLVRLESGKLGRE